MAKHGFTTNILHCDRRGSVEHGAVHRFEPALIACGDDRARRAVCVEMSLVRQKIGGPIILHPLIGNFSARIDAGDLIGSVG